MTPPCDLERERPRDSGHMFKRCAADGSRCVIVPE
jgi:hypothetical protein